MIETMNVRTHVDGKSSVRFYSVKAVMNLLLLNSNELRKLEAEGKLTLRGTAAMPGYPSDQVDKLLAEMRRP